METIELCAFKGDIIAGPFTSNKQKVEMEIFIPDPAKCTVKVEYAKGAWPSR
jgi:hypothetical protein